MLHRARALTGLATPHTVRTDYPRVIQGVRSDVARIPTPLDEYNALLLVYPRAVFVGWSAARLHTVKFSEGHPPEIWLPRYRKRNGVVIRTGALPVDDVVTLQGRPVTSGVRTAVDLARYVPDDRAIAAVDQCIRKDRYGRSLTTPAEMRAYLAAHPELHRIGRVRAVIAEADDGSESPWETYSRLVVHRAGLWFFRTQTAIAGTSYRTDLGAPEYRVAVEFDGDHHRSSAQQTRDVERWNAIQDAGWHIARVTSKSLMSDRGTLLAQIAAELRRRGWRGRPPSIPNLDI